MTAITLNELSFRYPNATEDTIKNLSLSISSGEAHALLGASGAGKTTLLNLLSGLLKPTSGRVFFNERDVSHVNPRTRNIAQVFQFPVLYEALTVEENLTFPLRNYGYASSVIEERLRVIVDELELGAIVEAPANALSLFEKQLVSVGKALVRPDVAIVLLDEPLTAVEPRRKWQLRQSLKRVQADLGVTMIYVTHDQTEALTFANRVSVLNAEGILQTGSPQEIYDKPAHEFVGEFVGSPGMDFLTAEKMRRLGSEYRPGQRFGVRPGWVELCRTDEAHVVGDPEAFAVHGTVDGEAVGVLAVQTQAGKLNVRHQGSVPEGGKVGVRVNRAILYENKLMVKIIEL